MKNPIFMEKFYEKLKEVREDKKPEKETGNKKRKQKGKD